MADGVEVAGTWGSSLFLGVKGGRICVAFLKSNVGELFVSEQRLGRFGLIMSTRRLKHAR